MFFFCGATQCGLSLVGAFALKSFQDAGDKLETEARQLVNSNLNMFNAKRINSTYFIIS